MSWKIRLRSAEACAPDPFLSPDLVIRQLDAVTFAFDLALAEKKEASNVKGLRSREALHTAIILQLFTDKRALPDQVLPDDLDNDRRGWWGDSVGRVPEQGEADMGSHLWLLRRAPLTFETAQIANEMVNAALQPIADQGAVARFEIVCETSYAAPARGHVETGILVIDIKGYGQDGSKAYSQKFEVLWDQIKALAA